MRAKKAPPTRGNLCVVTPPEGPPRNARLHVWHEVPGLSTGITSDAGDALEITVSAEIYQATGTIWFRALIDGEVAMPSDVAFKTGDVKFDGARSFTFVQQGVSAGQHLVEIQWRTGTEASVRDRVLTVCSGSAATGPIRLATAAAPSGPLLETSSSTYSDIPGLSASIVSSVQGTLAAVFSAEAFASSGQMMVRALLNGTAMGEITFCQAGDPARGGTRSFTFARSILPPGPHEVRLQWKAVGGKCQIGDRTLSVSSAPITSQRAAGRKPQTPIVLKGGEWTGLGATSFVSSDPVSIAAVSFSGEVTSNKGRIFIRVLFDDQPASPSDVTLIEGGPKWRATSYTFIVKHLRAGIHRVRIEGLSDPNTKAQVRSHSLRVQWSRRSGSDFVQPFRGAAPRVRTYRLLVIGCDPKRPAHPAPAFAQVKAVFEGDPDIVVSGRDALGFPGGLPRGLNLRGWLEENSGGLVRIGEIRYYGCGNDQWYVPPLEHQGNWYWDNLAWDVMFRDAVEAADADVDFHSYDTDGSNRIDPDETLIALIRPQMEPYGTLRGATAILDGASSALSMPALDLYISNNSMKRMPAVGVAAHELCHLIFDGMDLYNGCPAISAVNYNIMDQFSKATHLDPFEKMKNGLVHPDAIELSTLPTTTFTLPSVERHRKILLLHDADHVTGEYFIVENRFGGSQNSPNYDTPLGPGAVVVWQIFENLNLVQGSAICPGDVRIVRMRAVLTTPGQSHDLEWADGSPAGFRVTATVPASDQAQVRLEKL